MPSGVLSSHPRVRNLSSARRLSPDWGRRPYYGGVLAHRAACGEQDPESRPTVSPALLAIAFHRSDPDLAANFGGKLVGLCVRTLWAPSPPLWTNKPERQGRTSAPHGRQLTACSGPRESPQFSGSPGEIQKETHVGAQKCQGPKVRWS